MGSSGMSQMCVMQTPVGLASVSGVVFNGSSEAVPIAPPYPYSGLRPIPNQEMEYTYTNAPVIGMYIHFYKTIRDKLKNAPDNINGVKQYTLTTGPEFSLKNTANQLLAVNSGAMAFSANGNWMVVDVPFQGFVRVNLATFEIMPFAPSMNAVGDYKNYAAQLTISDDGRYVAVRPGVLPTFKVFDLDSCNDTVLPVDPAASPKCQSRDYWDFLSSHLSGLKSVYQPRFTGGEQLSLAATYNYSAGAYQVAQYTLTAPGVRPTGIGYLGMGDSYASGQGAFNYILGTDTDNNTCHLSSLSYPYLLSADLFPDGHSAACSGARMKDVYGNSQTYQGQNAPYLTKPELENKNILASVYLGYEPGYILQKEFVNKYRPQTLTISIGGNDIGFADIVSQCVMPKIKNTTCYATYEDQQELVQRIKSVKDKLRSTYKSLAAPGRQIYVIGYPQIVMPHGNCADNVHLNEQEIELFESLTTLLDETIHQAADDAGVNYVDVSNAFIGHRMCEAKAEDIAVNGLTAGKDDGIKKVKFIGAESYHPNALGHWLLEQAILGQTHNLKDGVSGAVPATPALPFSDAPKTGWTISTTSYDADLAPDVVGPGDNVQLQVPLDVALLKTSTTYTITLDDEQPIGTAATDSSGVLTPNVSIPGTVECGMHVLHIFGRNLADEPLDIYKSVFVTTGTDTCAGSTDPCGIIPMSETDIDRDGIDDACDPQIGKPPSYNVYLTGSSIHIRSQ